MRSHRILRAGPQCLVLLARPAETVSDFASVVHNLVDGRTRQLPAEGCTTCVVRAEIARQASTLAKLVLNLLGSTSCRPREAEFAATLVERFTLKRHLGPGRGSPGGLIQGTPSPSVIEAPPQTTAYRPRPLSWA